MSCGRNGTVVSSRPIFTMLGRVPDAPRSAVEDEKGKGKKKNTAALATARDVALVKTTNGAVV